MPAVPREENRSPDRGEELPFRKLGPYEVQKKIGSGGMGTVYLGIDQRLRRKVALKVLTPEKAENQTLLRRFRAEAANAAQLRHENVVAIFDTGEDQGYNYITMEYVDGTDVQRLLDVRGRIPIRRSLEIVKQVATALLHADRNRIVHRDIKPANILITREGVVKLADLGLARSIEDALESGITRAGMTVGTVDYMSPEQAQDSKSADTKSDIYSLGCTWYQMLTGKAPFPNGNLTTKLRDHAHSERPNPRDLNPEVPEGMVAVIQRMMAVKPRDRYQTPGQLLKELENPNILSDTLSRKLFEEDPSSAEIPQVARQLLDEAETEESIRVEGYHRQMIDDDEEEIEIPRPAASGKQQAVSGKQSPTGKLPPLDPRGTAPTGKQKAVAGNREPAPNPTGKQKAQASPKALTEKLPARGEALNTRGQLSRREREERDASTWQWRGLTGFAVIVFAVVVVIFGGILWDQVKSYIFAPDAVVTQNLGEAKANPTASTTQPEKQPETKTPQQSTAPNTPTAAQPTTTPVVPVAAGSQLDWKQRLTILPAWTAETLLPEEKLPKYTVGPGASPDTQTLSLNDALASLSEIGGIIELAGDGPFPLRSAVIAKPTLIIRAAPGFHPTIVAGPDPESDRDSILEFENGLLVLQGLAFQTQADSLKSMRALVSVSHGGLTVKECSFGSDAPITDPVAAIRHRGTVGKSGSAALAPLLIDRTIVDADGLTGLEIESPRLEAVIRQSLFNSGKAPALSFRSPPANPDDAVILIADHSTFASASIGLRLELLGTGDPVPVGIGLIESILAGQGDNASLLAARSWPLDELRTELIGPLKNLRLSAADTRFTAWKHLLDVGTDDTSETDDPQQWPQRYRSGGAPADFSSDPWPAAPGSTKPLALDRWRGESFPGSEGKRRGCDIALLPDRTTFPPADSLAFLRPTPLRPRIDGPQVPIDASTEDVGKKISEGTWQDRTTFLLSGTGTRPTSPIDVKGKSLCLEFTTPSLILSPNPIAFRPKSNAEPAKSLCNVTDGFLEIRSGKFLLSSAERIQPQHFLSVDRGGFALDRTQVEFPVEPNAPSRPFLVWNSPGNTPDSAFGIIHQSRLLAGSGNLFDISSESQTIVVRNSLLVARDNLLNILPGAGTAPLSVDLEQSTLAAGKHIVSLNPASPPPAPIRIFADSCLYTGLNGLRKTATPAALLQFKDEAALKALTWRETNCGYDNLGVNRFLIDNRNPSNAEQNFQDTWLKHWGSDAVRNPLYFPTAVAYMDSPNRDIARLLDNSYVLRTDSSAHRGGPNQIPLGAGKITIAPRPKIAPVPKPAATTPSTTPPPRKSGGGI